ncbi:MAG: TrmH family RNA methyltransferase [Gemmatimonadetes bacterium]|nr:MAG: TrmH family RNA methyltransferase [Gemmatimonadota bacterium]
MDPQTQQDLIEFLTQHITPERRARIDEVLTYRTRYITLVLEDVYQPHNASAVLRSCDCFGIQDVHIIEKRNAYKVNTDVALGASQWLTLHRFRQEDPAGGVDATQRCFNHLREKGYYLIATTPHTDRTLEEVPLDQPLALVLGTELLGLSSVALELADERVKIPMYGFTESFNISVSAAVMLYHLIRELHHSGRDWHLSEDEMQALRLAWIRKSLKRKTEPLERRFFETYATGK